PAYKEAILKANPEDIVLTLKVSGVPAAVINTPYIQKQGLGLNPVEKYLMNHKQTRKWIQGLRHVLGAKALEKAASVPTWKEVWSAGQGVGLIDEVLPAETIVKNLVREYGEAVAELP